MAAPSEFQSPRPVPNQFAVKIAGDVPPGVYEVRVFGKYGLSNPRSFVVGAPAEALEVEPNNDVKTATVLAAGAVMNGAADQEGARLFQVHGDEGRAAGDRLPSVSDRFADGSDAGRARRQWREAARGRDNDRRDPVVEFVAPADGDYWIKLYDFTLSRRAGIYLSPVDRRGAAGRLCVSAGGRAGHEDEVHAVRPQPSRWTPAERPREGRQPLDQLAVEIDVPGDPAARERLASASMIEPQEAGLDGFDYRLTGPNGQSNPVRLYYATAPVVVEQEPNNEPAKAQKLSLPCEVAGQF